MVGPEQLKRLKASTEERVFSAMISGLNMFYEKERSFEADKNGVS